MEKRSVRTFDQYIRAIVANFVILSYSIALESIILRLKLCIFLTPFPLLPYIVSALYDLILYNN